MVEKKVLLLESCVLERYAWLSRLGVTCCVASELVWFPDFSSVAMATLHVVPEDALFKCCIYSLSRLRLSQEVDLI